MHTGTKISLGLGAAATVVVAGGLAAASRAARDDTPIDPYIDPAVDYPPFDERLPGHPYPGNPTTSPGDEPYAAPVQGRIDPPGFWDDYSVDGDLRGSRLEATIDPRGWLNDINVSGRVDHSGFDTRIDPRGWGNETVVTGARTRAGYDGTVDRPGLWNDVRHNISETVRGASVIREGRFDETLVPSFMEASWRSQPADVGGGARVLEFDPPGWANNTRVDLVGNPPAGVEATIAAHLFDTWRTEQERQENYPDPGYPTTPSGPTGPGDDGYPTGPGDDGSGGYPIDPSYPDVPGDYPVPGYGY